MKIEMKKFFLVLTTVIAVSCSSDKDDNETLYEVCGVIKEDSNISGKLYIRSDDGKVIIPSLSNLLSNKDCDSRVWIMFSTDNDLKSDTIKANVYDFLIITQMDFRTQNDESVSDNVSLRKIWVAQDYLTLIMDVTASSENSLKNHKYTMFLDEELINNIEEVRDTVHLEFKYDRNNDSNTQSFAKMVALKLDGKINAKTLAIKYKTGSTFNETFVTYVK
jgi:hypothetical protein